MGRFAPGCAVPKCRNVGAWSKKLLEGKLPAQWLCKKHHFELVMAGRGGGDG